MQWNIFGGLLAALILAINIPPPVNASNSHPITTFIDAKWNVTPVALEVAEFLADENPGYYWKFIDELNGLRPALNRLESDSKQYLTALKLAKKFLGDSQTELLKLSLSLRSLSPRIQAHLQIARDALENATPCKEDAFAVVDGNLICSFADVELEVGKRFEESQKAKKKNKGEAMQQFNFDQLFPGSESHPVSVVVYNEIGSESSRKYHELLQGKATTGIVKLINRHYVLRQRNQKVRLSGYGVELHMKSTEYKSQDDSPNKAEDEVPADMDSGETEINGFDFAVLK